MNGAFQCDTHRPVTNDVRMAEHTGEKDEEVGTYTLWLYVHTGVFCLNCCSICEKDGCTAWIKWYWWKLTLILNEYLSCHCVCVCVMASVVCACEGQCRACVWRLEWCACVWGPICCYGCVCPRLVCIKEINIIVILVWFLLCCIVKNT